MFVFNNNKLYDYKKNYIYIDIYLFIQMTSYFILKSQTKVTQLPEGNIYEI